MNAYILTINKPNSNGLTQGRVTHEMTSQIKTIFDLVWSL